MLLGARDYDPQIGRWVSKDPSRFRGGINLYMYSWNDPVNFRDRTGRQPTGAGGTSGAGEGGSEGTGGIPWTPAAPPAPAGPDWCGSGWSGPLVPEGGFGVDWSDACKTHDECYGNCGSNKFLCDYSLQEDMSLSCAVQGGGMPCYATSGAYFSGVQTWLGDEAYDNAQAGCMCQ